jgi:hypothetical protein
MLSQTQTLQKSQPMKLWLRHNLSSCPSIKRTVRHYNKIDILETNFFRVIFLYGCHTFIGSWFVYSVLMQYTKSYVLTFVNDCQLMLVLLQTSIRLLFFIFTSRNPVHLLENETLLTILNFSAKSLTVLKWPSPYLLSWQTKSPVYTSRRPKGLIAQLEVI